MKRHKTYIIDYNTNGGAAVYRSRLPRGIDSRIAVTVLNLLCSGRSPLGIRFDTFVPIEDSFH